MMNIYTKTGDEGETCLLNQVRTKKSAPIIDALGYIDELNAALGLVVCQADQNLRVKLRRIQQELINLAGEIARLDVEGIEVKEIITAVNISCLEKEIDAKQSNLVDPHGFVLPGENELNARLHLARTVCRRAERAVVKISHESQNQNILAYLNRLSDWLFMMAKV